MLSKSLEIVLRSVSNSTKINQDPTGLTLIEESKYQFITSLVDPQVSILSPKYGFRISSVLLSQ